MEEQSYSYRETPRTGRTPSYSDHELDPEYVDPAVLTDDRENPDLLTFEKTWGHRLLAGLGVAMIVIAIVLVAFCIVQIIRVWDVVEILPMYSMLLYMYIGVLVASLALVPPACIAIYVAKHPERVYVAIGMAILALVLVVGIFICLVLTVPEAWIQAMLYSLLLAILPIIYLIAALKIKRSL